MPNTEKIHCAHIRKCGWQGTWGDLKYEDDKIFIKTGIQTRRGVCPRCGDCVFKKGHRTVKMKTSPLLPTKEEFQGKALKWREVFADPDNVGESSYRAIHNAAAMAAEVGNVFGDYPEPDCEITGEALGILIAELDSLREWAEAALDAVKSKLK